MERDVSLKRASDSQHRKPVALVESMNEYLAIDSGGYLCSDILCALMVA